MTRYKIFVLFFCFCSFVIQDIAFPVNCGVYLSITQRGNDDR